VGCPGAICYSNRGSQEKLIRASIASVDDAFILYLFQIIEGVSDDVNDPYHYPVIRVLVICSHVLYGLLSNNT